MRALDKQLLVWKLEQTRDNFQLHLYIARQAGVDRKIAERA